MKKTIIIALVALSLTFSFQMVGAGYDTFYEDYDMAEPEPSEVPENAEEAGLVYIHIDMDFFSYIPGKGWYPEEYSSMLIFFNENSIDPSSSIAVSSIIYPVDENQRDAQTQIYLQQVQKNLEYVIKDITMVKMENYDFNGNSAYWYYYTGKLISDDTEVAGEYMYWWIDDREYTCSMYCCAEEYDQSRETG